MGVSAPHASAAAIETTAFGNRDNQHLEARRVHSVASGADPTVR
jgi:hypothetical protein